ncbi:sigma-70 family RNA polymerase sigma factor [Stappia sp.]|uniref:sigma-70 family RNA polymerase sigma factor n=1 Tax=Stappia sp. TaxID=1870903 RepID=UPI003A99712B
MGFAKGNLETYRLHRRRLVDYAASIVGDRSRGEDIVQEAFIRMGGVASDRRIDEPVGYLLRIVRNLALDWRRRNAGEVRLFDPDFGVEDAAEDRPSIEDELAHKEQLHLLMQALSELPARTRLALELHRFEGLKLREIAVRLDISVSLAHSLVFQGLDHCRRRLAKRS